MLQSFRCPMGGKGDRGFSLPVMFLPANIGEFDGADTLGNGTERRACTDRLKLFMITNENELGTTLLASATKRASCRLATMPASSMTRISLRPSSFPPRLQPYSHDASVRAAIPMMWSTFCCLAGEGSTMNTVTLRFPGLACSRQHRRFARPGKADHSGNLVGGCDVPNSRSLLIRETRTTAASHPVDVAPDRILFALTPWLFSLCHAQAACRHRMLDIDHLARRVFCQFAVLRRH